MATAPKKKKAPVKQGFFGSISNAAGKVARAAGGTYDTLKTAGDFAYGSIPTAVQSINPFATAAQRGAAQNQLVNIMPNQYNTAVGNTISTPVANILSSVSGVANLAKAKSIADKQGFGALLNPSYVGNIAAGTAVAGSNLLPGRIGLNTLAKFKPNAGKILKGTTTLGASGVVGLGSQVLANRVAGGNTVTSPFNKLVDPTTGLLKPGYSAQQSLGSTLNPTLPLSPQGNTTENMPLPLNLRTPSPETIVPLTDAITSNIMNTFGGAIANPELGTSSTGSDVNANIPPVPMLGVQGSTDGLALGPATTMQTGIPSEVASATAAYNAALASAANQSYQNQIALRDRAATSMMQSQGIAADIIGGTAPALLGQFLTGDRRTLQQGVSAETQRAIANQIALEQSYNEALQQVYTAQAIANQKAASDRALLAAQIKGLGL